MLPIQHAPAWLMIREEKRAILVSLRTCSPTRDEIFVLSAAEKDERVGLTICQVDVRNIGILLPESWIDGTITSPPPQARNRENGSDKPPTIAFPLPCSSESTLQSWF